MDFIFNLIKNALSGDIFSIGTIFIVILLFLITYVYVQHKIFKRKVDKDNKINYDEVEIPYHYNRNNPNLVYIYYKNWEQNKKKYINKKFKPGKTIFIDGIEYEILRKEAGTEIDNDSNGKKIEKSYIQLQIQLYKEPIQPIHNSGNINNIVNTGVMGNVNQGNNFAELDQLINLIEDFNKSRDIDDNLKMALEIIRLQIRSGEQIKKPDDSTLTKLSSIAKSTAPFASLAGSILKFFI